MDGQGAAVPPQRNTGGGYGPGEESRPDHLGILTKIWRMGSSRRRPSSITPITPCNHLHPNERAPQDIGGGAAEPSVASWITPSSKRSGGESRSRPRCLEKYGRRERSIRALAKDNSYVLCPLAFCRKRRAGTSGKLSSLIATSSWELRSAHSLRSTRKNDNITIVLLAVSIKSTRVG